MTSVAIREARVRELRQEILNSSQLKRYLEEHPTELQHLRRHDNELRTTRQQAHLRHIPDYLLPEGGRKALSSNEVGFVPLRKPDKKFRGHKKGGILETKEGELAVLCRACPHPTINLPVGWDKTEEKLA